MITLTVNGGPPTFEVGFVEDMNIQDALEAAFNASSDSKILTFSLQFYGNSLGYLVNMVNETYDSFIAPNSYQPFFYWEILLNNTPITKGIDNTKLMDGDSVEFIYTRFVPEVHGNSTLAVKFKQKALSQSN
ncbi:MAG TPA: DUF4430 domain-containing protein [Chitinophagaceae bacterium]|jgi:hypothetical protein|nr:DUF4430 domain-containing protein [Chitinophagaceae bacterium]